MALGTYSDETPSRALAMPSIVFCTRAGRAGCLGALLGGCNGVELTLDCKEIQPVHSEGDQPWVFFGRNDAKADRKSTRLNSSHKHRSRMPSSA